MPIMNYLKDIKSFHSYDGCLTAFEPSALENFKVERVFWIYNVPPQSVRAEHACMNAELVSVAVNGSLTISLENHKERVNFILNNKEMALIVEPGTWIKAYDFSEDGVLMCLSDKKYEDCIYIDNYDEYISMEGKR